MHTAMIDHSDNPRILISGGGTGGHIFPAVSIANAVKRRIPGSKILFVGAENRMEMERVPAAGYKIVGLPVAGIDRRRPWRNFMVAVKLIKSMRKATKVLRDFRPDIAVGVGGYASGPMLKAAQRNGIPTLIQEQNSYAGVTNKLLSAKAKAICVAYEGMERFFPADRIIMTGNPVRADLFNSTLSANEARHILGFPEDEPLVVVLGGSLGARSVNESVAAAMNTVTATGANILWQTGKLYADECSRIAAGNPKVKATPFISSMDAAYRAATLVVSRAGAGTISELQLLGVPAILIPSPNVAEDHQRKNALALVEHDAAIMIPDAEAVRRLASSIIELLDNPARRVSMSANISAMALKGSDDAIVDKIIEIINTAE